jgi:hypothetical protein
MSIGLDAIGEAIPLEQSRTVSLEERRKLARASLHEYPEGMLERRGAYWVDPSGALYMKPVGQATLPDGTPVLGSAVAFTVHEGGMVYLTRPRGAKPRTVEELDAQERAKEAAARAKQERTDKAIRRQPVEAVTLADVEGLFVEGLPSLRQAAATVLRYGRIDTDAEGRLIVSVPQTMRRQAAYLNAARVLYAGAPHVSAWLATPKRKPEDLPDAHALPSGALAP